MSAVFGIVTSALLIFQFGRKVRDWRQTKARRRILDAVAEERKARAQASS